MWGKKSLPQTKVIPLCDLVITHGGNNTVTESFFFGKPMIVLPLSGDQFDNAQIIQERKFGLRLDPYECTHEELLSAVDNLVYDKQLAERLTVVSKRIQNSRSNERAADVVENVLLKK
jgi:UDP:flavonoid glycosyltransferase YjiC (YdhE family)